MHPLPSSLLPPRHSRPILPRRLRLHRRAPKRSVHGLPPKRVQDRPEGRRRAHTLPPLQLPPRLQLPRAGGRRRSIKRSWLDWPHTDANGSAWRITSRPERRRKYGRTHKSIFSNSNKPRPPQPNVTRPNVTQQQRRRPQARPTGTSLMEPLPRITGTIRSSTLPLPQRPVLLRPSHRRSGQTWNGSWHNPKPSKPKSTTPSNV